MRNKSFLRKKCNILTMSVSIYPSIYLSFIYFCKSGICSQIFFYDQFSVSSSNFLTVAIYNQFFRF